MSIIDCSSSKGPRCLWLACNGGRHRMTDGTILEFVGKHCKQDKRHDAVLKLLACVMWSYDAGAERIV